MFGRFSRKRVVGLAVGDWLLTIAALALADQLRSHFGLLPGWFAGALMSLEVPFGGFAAPAYAHTSVQIEVYLLATVIWPGCLGVVFKAYDGRTIVNHATEALHVIAAVAFAFVLLAGILYLSYRSTPRVTMLIFGGLDLVFLVGVRFVLWTRQAVRSRPVAQRRSVVVVGAGAVGRRVVGELTQLAWSNIRLIGFVDDNPNLQASVVSGLPVLGATGDSERVVAAYGVRDAVIALPLTAHDKLVDVSRRLQALGVQVHVVPDLFALSFPGARMEGFGGIPVISLGLPGLHGSRRSTKAFFDLILASLILVAVSPLFALVAALVRMSSPGPVFFRQRRIGEHGREFLMLKFRSMYVNNDSAAHREHMRKLIVEQHGMDAAKQEGSKSLKMENDPRITRIGRWIRKSSIDELPQLINVLRGEMSLVGPRPALPYEVDLYQDWHKQRFNAIPGITGLWQVRGRNRVSFDEMVRMDVDYIERQSFWLDLEILFRTPAAVLQGAGAG